MLDSFLSCIYLILCIIITLFFIIGFNRVIFIIDRYLAEKNNIRRFSVNVTTPNDGEALKALDDLINNTIAEYYALNIGYRGKGINSKMEEQMHKEITQLVSVRISSVLIDKLTFYYDKDCIDGIIASKCYIKITDFVISQNSPE